MKGQTLWTRNYTTITIGTIISAIGGVGLNFALTVLIYNETSSTLLSAIFSAVIMLPNIVLPLIIGPYIDKFSRKKIIVISDMCMAALFLGVAYATKDGYFAYIPFMVLGVLISTNGVIYGIAYESLFPELIPEGMLQKGYSISSLIYPTVNTLVLPIAAIVFDVYGVFAIFLIEGILLAIASLFEMRIQVDESQVKRHKDNPQSFLVMVKEGITYLRSEHGIMAIFLFFFFLLMSGEGVNVLLYPFFENHPVWTVTQYALLISFATGGRLFGGVMHYFVKIPSHYRFNVAAFVYFSLTIINGILLFLGYPMMIVAQVFVGLLSINSFNIRMSSVQSYVPSDKRGRVNGIYHIMSASGAIIGRLVAGALGEFFPFPMIALFMSMGGMAAFFLIIIKNKESVKLVYNRTI